MITTQMNALLKGIYSPYTWKTGSRSLLLGLLLCAGLSVHAQQYCGEQTGTNGGYYFSWWNDGEGSFACMTMGAGGNYSTSWNTNGAPAGKGNLVGGKGWPTGSYNRVIGYNAGAFNGGSNGYLCAYGWTQSPLIEYYIVDNYGDYTPPGNQELRGTIESDGGTYNIYRTFRDDKPSIESNSSDFFQYWSVRTQRRPNGTNATITFANHASAWASLGWNLGNYNYQIMATEGFQSVGNSNVTVWQSGTSNGANNIIDVRAKGVQGGERIQVKVNNQVVGDWPLGNYWQTYVASTPKSGNILVEYYNDGPGKDVQIDYISVNGNTRQAENQSYNTGVWQGGSCGGSNSQWLHCNGAIGFGSTAGKRELDASAPALQTRFFPNPLTAKELQVEFASEEEIETLSILDLQGRRLIKAEVGGLETLQLPVDLTSGVYLIRFRGTQQTWTQKLIIP